MTIRVLDIETTGTDPAKDRIVEIAAVDVTKDRALANAREHLVNPGMPIPPRSSAVHHIIDADVEGEPTFDMVLPEYLGATFYVAHNAAFEQSFLERHGLKPWICTYKCALRVWPEWEQHTNQFLRYRLGHIDPMGHERQTINPHRALSDVIVTAGIFVELLKLAKWADMVKWSAEPALTTIIPFSKHRGKRWDSPEVDEGFLDWVLKQPDMDEGFKFSARYWKTERAKRRAAA